MKEHIEPTLVIYKVITGQVLIAGVAALLFLLQGMQASYSALIGGGIAVLTNIYFVRYVFKQKRRNDPKKFLSGLYFGETIKFVVAFALFGLVFKLHSNEALVVDALALFVGFFATTIAYWYALKTYR